MSGTILYFLKAGEKGSGVLFSFHHHLFEAAFGLTNDLNLVTVEPSKEGTIVTWDEYYDAQDLDMNKAAYDQALTDIGENLVRRFGGMVVERYVKKNSKNQ